MNTSHYMYLSYRFAIIFFYHIHHLVDTQFPAFIAMGIYSRIGTKCAGKYTNICWLYMKIPIEIGLITMHGLTFIVSQSSGKSKSGLFKKKYGLIEKNPFSVYCLFTNSAKLCILLITYNFPNLFCTHIHAIIYNVNLRRKPAVLLTNLYSFI